MWTAEEKSYIWLDSFLIDPAFKNALVKEADGAANLVRHFARFEEVFAKKGKADEYAKMQKTLDGDRYFKELTALYEREGIACITRATDGYFSAWKEMPDAPCVVYVKGDVGLIKTRLFAVVGSRKIKDAYKKSGGEICEGLAEHFTILTGAAEGGDEVAARAALKKGKVVCVLAGGFHEAPKDGGDFLREAGEKGAVIAVCPHTMTVRNYSYERRNRLMAACVEGALILSAGERSGALTTAEYATKFDKPVFALPYPPNDAAGVGYNRLIKKGAYLAENLIDITAHFGINLEEKKSSVPLTAEEKQVYERLKESGESHLSVLSQALGVPVFKLAAILARLEVKGLVAKSGGNRYLAN